MRARRADPELQRQRLVLERIEQMLLPLLGAKTTAVVTRLRGVVVFGDSLDRWVEYDQELKGRLQTQVRGLVASWDALRTEAEAREFATSAQFDPVEPLLDTLRILAPATGAPNTSRALVLDCVLRALGAAGLDPTLTDLAVVEQVASVVLRAVGDDIPNVGDDVAAAIRRFHQQSAGSSGPNR